VIPPERELGDRILLVAPRGRDRLLLADALHKAGRRPQILGSLDDLLAEAGRGAGVLLLEEEAIDARTAPALLATLAKQPPWSDLPVVLLTTPSRIARQTRRLVESLGRSANVVLLERPIRILTLVQTVESALRARRRQYEVRDLQGTLETRVAERTAQLEATLKEMDTFSYTIAHDLRAPLRHLYRFSEALDLECGASLTPDCADYLRHIRSGAERMDALVQDILRYSRLTRTELSVRPVDLQSLVAGVLKEMAPELRDRNARVQVGRLTDLVLADPLLLSQALTNLVSNAVKFVAPGTAPAVRIRTERRGAWTRIWVEDNGIGIAARHHGRVFEIFERLHGSEAYGGTGIGLAIVRRVVERQGGRVGLESEEGRGSRFWIDLPSPGEAKP
jgi:signal transduction histidine kinase